ncbi:MAG: DUF1343 domain-containing protein [Thermoanaerobaculia bacterium]
MIGTGLDLLLAETGSLQGRRYGVLAHSAAVSANLVPIHLALLEAGAETPQLLIGPEHGFYGVEQDMVAAADGRDPLTGLPVVSLYGDTPESLRPEPGLLAELDLLIIDLQDVGARYYTYAATAVWTAEVALATGCEVWVLDRPNPLGGVEIEGNLPRPGFESFVGAFALPVRHGLTLGELVRLEARRRGWTVEPRVWKMEGWRREMLWAETGRPWMATSPNLPTAEATLVYPGSCLIEATQLSEGRGTTRPFQLIGAPGIEPRALAAELASSNLAGVRFVPTYFRPQYQKHAGETCGGVYIQVTEPGTYRPYRSGVELLAAVRRLAPAAAAWRTEAYEFVVDRPAIDLLAGDDALRLSLEADQDAGEWMAGWSADEESFRAERREILIYPEASPG